MEDNRTTLTKFSEYVYGCPIILTESKTDQNTKIAYGENGTQMSITAGDEIVIVDLKSQQIVKWTVEFNWGEYPGIAPWGFSFGEICFIGKI